MSKAADRIEKLERYQKESKQRIDILEDAIQRWRDTDGQQRLRIEALEKALREIDQLFPVELFEHNAGFEVRKIARRALEGK